MEVVDHKGALVLRERFRFPSWQRMGASLLLMISTVCVALNVSTAFAKKDGELNADLSQVQIEEYKQKRGVFRLVEVFDVSWTGGGAVALLPDGSSLPFALILGTPSAAGVFKGTACALRFQVSPVRRLPQISITGIVATVNSFREFDSYEPRMPAPYHRSSTYLVQIGDPAKRRERRFFASYYASDGTRLSDGKISVQQGEQEDLLLRIDASDPGIYNFTISLLIEYQNQKEEVIVIAEEDFLFDRAQGPQ